MPESEEKPLAQTLEESSSPGQGPGQEQPKLDATLASSSEGTTPTPPAGSLDQTLASSLAGPTPPPHLDKTLAESAFTATDPNTVSLATAFPQIVGYRILGELGRGGMGIVYKAEQQSLKRIVALKMILDSTDAGPEQIKRFRTEAEVLASLNHPHIVQIYEVGSYQGRPFLSMEYCPGGSLATKLAGTLLSARDAARTIETLARAIHAAHTKGIVHRDLKPHNVLLMDEEFPKITDFGLAKRLHGGLTQTRTGQIKGTPSYMAPEQAGDANKDIGPAADIYALGAILYDLLTGRPPFMATSLGDMILQVLRKDPVPPRQLQASIPRDLETICMKCLEKDPKQRYGSALELAQDLRNFLDEHPIHARPIGTMERGRRWCRRNPVVATLLAMVAFLLVAGTTVSGYFAVQARSQAAEAQDKAKQLEDAYRINQAKVEELTKAHAAIGRQRQLLDQNFQKALQAISSFSQLRGVREEDLPRVRGLKDLLKQLVADQQQRIPRQNPGPQQLGDLAEAWYLLATVERQTGNTQVALAGYAQAEQWYGKFDRKTFPEHEGKLGLVHMYQGLLHNDAGDWGSARRHFEKALEQFGNLTGRYGNDPQYRHFKRHEAEAEHNFGIYWNNRRLFDDALNHYGRALRIRQELAAQAPLPEYVSDVARSHGWIGDVHVELQQWDKAREAYEQSLKLREELARQWPRDLETLFQFARGINNFGTLNLRKGDPAEALKHFARGVKIQETLVQEVPGKSEYRGDLGWTLNRLGAMQLALKNDDPEGRKNLQRSLDIYSRLYAVDPKVTYASNLGWSHAYLARSYLDAEPGKALPHLLEALDHLDKVVQMRHKEKVNVAPDDLYLLAFSRALGRELIQNPKAALAAEQKEQIQKQADEALPALQRACQAGYIASYYLENDRGMNSLRGFPEFKQLVQQAKEREKNQ